MLTHYVLTLFTGIPVRLPPPTSIGAPPPHILAAPPPRVGVLPPGAHMNPAFLAGAPGYPPPPSTGLSEVEFEEIMARNRTVSSSAIARAVQDAAANDFASAIETLVTAISLIKQSKVAHDERCRILITSLQVMYSYSLFFSGSDFLFRIVL